MINFINLTTSTLPYKDRVVIKVNLATVEMIKPLIVGCGSRLCFTSGNAQEVTQSYDEIEELNNQRLAEAHYTPNKSGMPTG